VFAPVWQRIFIGIDESLDESPACTPAEIAGVLPPPRPHRVAVDSGDDLPDGHPYSADSLGVSARCRSVSSTATLNSFFRKRQPMFENGGLARARRGANADRRKPELVEHFAAELRPRPKSLLKMRMSSRGAADRNPVFSAEPRDTCERCGTAAARPGAYRSQRIPTRRQERSHFKVRNPGHKLAILFRGCLASVRLEFSMIATEDLKRLAHIPGPCLTIAEPVRHGTTQPVKTAAHLEAAGRHAEILLAQLGIEERARECFLRPILRIAANTDWPAHSGSVLIFRAPGFTKASFWPQVVKPDVHLDEEFFILPFLTSPVAFWVLGLSINDVSLFRGSAHGLVQVELPRDVPHSLKEAGGFDQPDHDLENHSYAGPSAGKSSARRRTVHFGTSSLREVQGRHLHDFFKMVDRGVRPLLETSGDPLLLAGISREVSLYEKVNTYARVIKESIHGSPRALGTPRLLEAAVRIAIPGFEKSPKQLSAKLETAAGRGLLVTDPDAILRAAGAGQIETLFIDPEITTDQQALNRSAIAVLRNSGTVESSPCLHVGRGVAAILRYQTQNRAGAMTATPEQTEHPRIT
jgi:hypothetical protein